MTPDEQVEAIRIQLPASPSGRLAFVMEMLNPKAWESCPTCGHEYRVDGAPLISKEMAAKLLDLPDPP